MNALLSLPRTPASLPETVVRADEPVALLQLDATDPIEAASAVYREVRRGRRVVAVASGGVDAPDRLLAALDELGIAREQVDYLFRTHVHLDDAGGAGRLIEAGPNDS